MSFDTNAGKKTTDVVQYNYYETPIGNREKTLENNGYLKFEFSNPASTGFSQPNLLFKNNQYVCEKIYVFNQFYGIQNVSYDGILVVENKPINNSVLDNLFSVFLLKTSSSILPNAIDGLFDQTTTSLNLSLNKFISSNQPVVYFNNVVLFSVPISIYSKITRQFITPQYVSIGLLNSYTSDYVVASAKQSVIQSGGQSLLEGFDQGGIYNSINEQTFDNDVTCKASDEVTGMDISRIAMVPVDSDFLNGVYQISMIRTLFDIFIFIIIMIFCIFVSPIWYKYFVVDFSKNLSTSDNSKMNEYISIIDIVLGFSFLFIGLFLSIDGINTSTSVEMILGIYFTLVVFFSICAIRYYKTTLGEIVFKFPNVNGIFNFLKVLFGEKHYLIFFIYVFLCFLFVLVLLWIFQTVFLFQSNINTKWTTLLFLIGFFVSIVLSYMVLVVYGKNTTT